jgi:hypothetical protein
LEVVSAVFVQLRRRLVLQNFCIAGDVPQVRAQIVRNRVTQCLQFLGTISVLLCFMIPLAFTRTPEW